VYWYVSLPAEDVPAPAEAPHDIVRRVARVSDDTFRAVVAATRPEDTRLDELVDRDPFREWGLGPVTLLGDAAHPMLPHTGQGAAQALEDAVALGLALHSSHEIAGSLRRYEQVRFLRTRRIVKSGRWIPRVTTSRNRFVRALRNAAIRVAPVRALGAAFTMAARSDPHRALRSHVRI
jgi:2-polyprenyl-6-methoxyphenol hydroxylase-like FAD-dependent oxidoreductase